MTRPRPRPLPVPDEPIAEAERGEAYPACRIKFHNRPIRTHFYAVPHEGGPVLARSPYFKLERGAGEQRPDGARGAARARRAAERARLAADRRRLGAVGPALPAQRPRRPAARLGRRYSHSIVPGGLDVMSSTTRLTSRISPIMREAICSSRS